MATVRKRGTKYEVQFRRRGFASLSRSFHKLADAREWSRLIEGQADRHELAPSRRSLEEITLSDLVVRYRDTVVPSLRGAARETITLNAFLRQPLCRKTLAELTVTDFVAYRDLQLKSVTPRSLQRMLSPIKHMFRLAIDEWDIPLTESPLAKLRLKVTDNKRQRRLQDGEFERLIAGARSMRNPYVMLIMRLAIETAMRRGEMLAVRWPQVDLKRRALTVLEAKNGHTRVIPLSSKAIEVLELARACAVDDEDRVFPMTANGFRLAWERLVRRSAIIDLHFHDLRHEAISRLFEIGLTAPEVASVSGHRDMRMLFRYAHASQASVRQKMSAID